MSALNRDLALNAVIVPVFNEMNNAAGKKLRAALAQWQSRMQILFVDGGSTDGTIEVLRQDGFDVLETSEQSRGARLQLGVEATVSEMVLLHHPRSVIDEQGLAWFAHCDDKAGWGGFRHRFDVDHPILRFTSWYSNRIRGRRGIVYLDHCIYAPRKWLVQCGGVPACAIFEDTELSKLLLRFGRPRIMPFDSVTSSIRFQHNGVLRQSLLNQNLKLAYYLGRSDRKMNEKYEQGLGLNSKYPNK